MWLGHHRHAGASSCCFATRQSPRYPGGTHIADMQGTWGHTAARAVSMRAGLQFKSGSRYLHFLVLGCLDCSNGSRSGGDSVEPCIAPHAHARPLARQERSGGVQGAHVVYHQHDSCVAASLRPRPARTGTVTLGFFTRTRTPGRPSNATAKAPGTASSAWSRLTLLYASRYGGLPCLYISLGVICPNGSTMTADACGDRERNIPSVLIARYGRGGESCVGRRVLLR